MEGGGGGRGRIQPIPCEQSERKDREIFFVKICNITIRATEICRMVKERIASCKIAKVWNRCKIFVSRICIETVYRGRKKKRRKETFVFLTNTCEGYHFDKKNSSELPKQ